VAGGKTTGPLLRRDISRSAGPTHMFDIQRIVEELSWTEERPVRFALGVKRNPEVRSVAGEIGMETST